jgi:hypothetical protein
LADTATLDEACATATAVRERLPGVRALGLRLGQRLQVSTNVERPDLVSLAELTAAVRERVPVTGAELVGLAPRAALRGFPADVPLDGGQRVLEDVLP